MTRGFIFLTSLYRRLLEFPLQEQCPSLKELRGSYMRFMPFILTPAVQEDGLDVYGWSRVLTGWFVERGDLKAVFSGSGPLL